MNITIPASISNKTVSVPCGSYVVANNNNYYLRFSFDEEWNEYALKTARFVIDEEYVDVDFSGDTVNIPAVTDSTLYEIHVGVYAGNLSTTTPARLLVYASVLGLPTSGQYQPDDPGTLLPNIEELALDDTIVATDVSEGERGKATMQQIVDLAEAQFGIEPYDGAPLNDGTASAGSSPKYARGDHRHPTDAVLANQISTLNGRAVNWDAKWGPDSGAYVIPESALSATTQLKIQRGANAYAALPDKQDKLTAGANITIDANNVISSTGGGGRYTVTYGVTTYAQIAEAYAGGMIPVCEVQGDVYELASMYATRAIFKHNGLAGAGSTVDAVSCTNTNVWSTSVSDFYSADEVDALAANAVKYTAQNLTDNQKAQARTNIGAASLSEVGTVMSFKGAVATVNDLPSTNNRVGDVYYVVAASTEYVWLTTTTYPNGYWEQFGEAIDMSGFVATTAQTLAAAQQAQARSNINAASATTVTQIGNAVSAIDGRVQTVERYAVRADQAQAFEADEQAQARSNIGAGTYSKPPSGIPASDLASGVIPSVPSASSATPQALGTAAAGSSADYSRADHVHDFDDDFKSALLQLAAKVAYIDSDGQTYYEALEAALTHKVLSSITAVFTQGQNVVYASDSLDTLKQYLVVTANYTDNTSETVTDYTLSGTLSEGMSTVTVTYRSKTTTFIAAVTYSVDVAPSLSTFQPGNATYAAVDYNASADTLRIYSKSSWTYVSAKIPFTAQKSGYDYVVSYDVIVTSGDHRSGFANANNQVRSPWSGQVLQSSHVEYSFPYLAEITQLYAYCTWSPAANGDCTISNFHIYERRSAS